MEPIAIILRREKKMIEINKNQKKQENKGYGDFGKSKS